MDQTMKQGQTKKFTPHFKGPYVITEIYDDLNYKLQANDKEKTTVVHYNRMKPFVSRELISEMGGARAKETSSLPLVQSTRSACQSTSPSNAQDTPTGTTCQSTTSENAKRSRGNKSVPPSNQRPVILSEYNLRSKAGKM